ncbi:HNH endonuclease [Sphingomonas sp. PB2P12]|uniref:HNH endonuclease n=1 Tax=Sphingomonas sandaracina TaxID=3096157 RepID=UPI002FCA2E67
MVRAHAIDETDRCGLCTRTLGRKVEWHHRIPKSRGGTEVLPVHPICHRIIHASVSNHDLATTFADLDALKARPDISRFLRWIADKPPDFHAPTRRPDSR